MVRILLLGRDTDMRDRICECLRIHRIEVAAETSAEDVLAALAQEKTGYAALVADGDLPETDMAVFLRKVRELSGLLTVIVSEKKEETDEIRALECGADAYFTKPLQIGCFTARLRALLRMQERLRGEEFRQETLPEMRGICMDPLLRQVRVRGRDRRVTRKEYDLLAFLMAHPGVVFTKEDLYREVWNEEAVGGLATVVMHIRKIRGLVEERPAQPQIIRTAWGAGYYFDQKEPEG